MSGLGDRRLYVTSCGWWKDPLISDSDDNYRMWAVSVDGERVGFIAVASNDLDEAFLAAYAAWVDRLGS